MVRGRSPLCVCRGREGESERVRVTSLSSGRRGGSMVNRGSAFCVCSEGEGRRGRGRGMTKR